MPQQLTFKNNVSLGLTFWAPDTPYGRNCIAAGLKNFAVSSYVVVTKKHPSGNRLKKFVLTYIFVFKFIFGNELGVWSPFQHKCDFHYITRFVVEFLEISKFLFLSEIAYVYSALSRRFFAYQTLLTTQGRVDNSLSKRNL